MYMYNFLSVPRAKCLTPVKETHPIDARVTPTIFLVGTTFDQPPIFSGKPVLNLTFLESTQRPSAP